MVKRRFRPGDMISGLFGFIEQRDGNVLRGHARAAKIAQGGVKRVPDLRRESVEEQLARNSQAKLSCISPQSGEFRQVRLPAHARVQNPRQSGDITYGPSQWPGAIQARRQRDNAFTRNAAPSWLHTADAAEGSGDADGAASVRADATETETGGNRGGGSSTRAAGNARGVPGIADRTIVRIV